MAAQILRSDGKRLLNLQDDIVGSKLAGVYVYMTYFLQLFTNTARLKIQHGSYYFFFSRGGGDHLPAC